LPNLPTNLGYSLASYGIETAADVDIGKVLAVPGFGPINSRPLIEWRDGLAKKFSYDPNPNAVDHAVLGKIRAETASKAVQLRRSCGRATPSASPACNLCGPVLCSLRAPPGYASPKARASAAVSNRRSENQR
jgi:hypothetical protein